MSKIDQRGSFKASKRIVVKIGSALLAQSQEGILRDRIAAYCAQICQLVNDGYSIKRIVNYKTSHNQVFEDDFIEKLKNNIPEIVYIYSYNSALSFLNFIKNERIESLWMNTNLMCIGEKTSSILNEIKWKKIFLFNPGEEEFLLYKI